MARFLLVAGSCHGAWCWTETIAALTHLGHQAQAIDLPGHGADPTPRAGITLPDYARAICGALTGPTLLVGHSMAGYPITAAAEQDPRHIAALVYLCAYRPRDGLSLADLRRQAARQPLRGSFRLQDGCFTFDPTVVEDRFYHDCPPGTLQRALAQFTPEPILPQETPLRLTERSAGRAQFYIRCTADRAIPPEHQTDMAADPPLAGCFDLPASHSPFFAIPDRLAARLDQIAGMIHPPSRLSSL